MEQATDTTSYLESKQISPRKLAMIKKDKQIVKLWEWFMKSSAFLVIVFIAVFVFSMFYFIFQIADELLTENNEETIVQEAV